MSITKSIITCGSLPGLYVNPSHGSQTRMPLNSCSNFAVVRNLDQSVFLGYSRRRLQMDDKSRRRFHVLNVVQPGVPPPSEPPVNLINWIMGLAITVVIPFFTHKWTSLLKLKNEVDTAVDTVEDVMEVVEKVADGVEKVTKDIADNLPQGGRLRKAADFVENVAERASNDAHLVADFIDKVQEAEDKVEEYVESLVEEATTHNHHQEEEFRAHEPPQEEEDKCHGPTKQEK